MTESEEDELPTLPPDYRLKPSRNQKRRSKLSQAPETPAAPLEPEPAAVAPAPAPVGKPPEPPPSKKMRMKRSGQMHEDLMAPMPEDPPAKKEDAY